MYKFNFDKGKEAGLFSKYSQLQVESIEAIVCEANNQGLTKEQIAYVLSTAYHEADDYNGTTTGTKQKIVPIKEKGGQAYLKAKKYYPYIGYGFVQITWLANYKKMQPVIQDRFGVDVVKNPELFLRTDIAAFTIVYGMKNAMFTSHKLSDHINDKKIDYAGARKIVNGTDKKDLIAGYARKFIDCIGNY